MKEKRTKIDSYHLVDFTEYGPDDAKETILLLHGYGEKAETIFRKLSSVLPSDVKIICPNGPFPMPKKTDEGFKMSYAWYFFDPIREQFFIDYDLPATLLQKFIKTQDLDQLPLTIIGYSQGGYLAPFVGQKLSNTTHVIGINCRFRYDMMNSEINFRLDAIHGAADNLVDPVKAHKSFNILKNKGIKGEFHIIEGEGHTLSNPIKKCLAKIIGS